MSFIGSEFTTTSLYSTELLHCLTWVEEFPIGSFLRFLYANIVKANINIIYIIHLNDELESHETLTQVTLSKLQKNNIKILAALILKKKTFCKGCGEKIKQVNRKSVPTKSVFQNFD